MIRTLIFVGLGSCLGGIARYLLSRLVQSSTTVAFFPLGTLAVNVLGCLAIGLLYGFFERSNLMSSGLRTFLTVGFCGGFTTFSTFALENFAMLRVNAFFSVMMYLLLSIVLGIGAVYAGSRIVRLW